MKEKEFVIFQDIDGVLNAKSSWKTPFVLNDECIKNFCTFVNRDGLAEYGCTIFSRTKDLGNRQKEIIDYLSCHDVDYYVIIDDDESEYQGFELGGVYLIDAETGFTSRDVKKIKWKKIT